MILLVTDAITFSFPAPSMIISPFLSSEVNLVPKPVTAVLLIVTEPDRTKSSSAITSAVKSA